MTLIMGMGLWYLFGFLSGCVLSYMDYRHGNGVEVRAVVYTILFAFLGPFMFFLVTCFFLSEYWKNHLSEGYKLRKNLIDRKVSKFLSKKLIKGSFDD